MFVNLNICLYLILLAWILAIINCQFVASANLNASTNVEKNKNPNQVCKEPNFENKYAGSIVYVRYEIQSDAEVKGKYVRDVFVKARVKKRGTGTVLKNGPRITGNKFKHYANGSQYYFQFELPESQSYIFCYIVKSVEGFENLKKRPEVKFEQQFHPFIKKRPYITRRDNSVAYARPINFFVKPTPQITTTTQRVPVTIPPPRLNNCFPLFPERITAYWISLRYYVKGDFPGVFISQVRIIDAVRNTVIKQNKFNHAAYTWLYFHFLRKRGQTSFNFCYDVSFDEEYDGNSPKIPKIIIEKTLNKTPNEWINESSHHPDKYKRD